MEKLIKAYEENNIDSFEDLIEEYLNDDKYSYNEIVYMYAKLLMNNDMFELAHNLLLKELSVPYIEKEYLDKFNNLFDEIQAELKYLDTKKESYSNEEIKIIFEAENNDIDKVMLIEYLMSSNIREHLDVLEDFLKSESFKPTLKTLVLEILVSQQVNKVIEIHKFGEVIEVNPSVLTTPFEHPITSVCIDILKNVIYDNPSLCQMAEELLTTYIINRYPTVDDINVELLCASIHGLTLVYNDEVVDFEYLEHQYDISSDVIEKSVFEVANFMEHLNEQ